MTISELLEVMPNCDLIEIVVRKNGYGLWIQGYRIGKNAAIYPSELTAEIREMNGLKSYQSGTVHLKPGEVVDISKGYSFSPMPMKVICKDCHGKIPEHIGRLVVSHAQPRHIPTFHREQLTHNEFSLDVSCYPDEYVPEVYIESKVTNSQKEIAGQMSIEDFIKQEG